MTPIIEFRNKDRLFQRLRQTIPAMDKQIRDDLAASGDEMVAKVKSLVPRDKGDLEDSVEWKWTKATNAQSLRSPAIIVQEGADNASDDAFYARWVEFGTPNTPKQPHFFPAYRLLRRKIRGRISRGMTKVIKRAGFGK